MLLPFAATCLSLVIVTAYGFLRRNHLIAFGLVWCVVNFFPISNILPLPSAPMAERYLYMPLIGVCMIVAAFLQDLRRQTGNWRLPVVLVLAAAIPFGVVTNHRNRTWRDDLTVVQAIVDDDPSWAIGHFELGVETYRRGDPARARQEFEQSLKLDRAFPQASWAQYYLGMLNMEAGAREEALRSLRNAASSGPATASAQYALAVLTEDRAVAGSLQCWQNFVRVVSLPSFPLLLEAQIKVRALAPAKDRHFLERPSNREGRGTGSPQWSLFYRYATGTSFYYDPSSVRDNGIGRIVLTMQQLVKEDSRVYASRIIRFPLRTVSNVRFSLAINCRQKLYKTTVIEFRDNEDSVLGRILPDAEDIVLFQYVLPGTPLRVLADSICSRG